MTPTPSVVEDAPELPVAPVAPVVLNGGCESFRPLVAKYDWDVATAMAIMKAESGCTPTAYNGSNSNGSNDAGLFQINSIHSDLITDRFNPEKNIQAAYEIYRGSGYKAWSVFNNGRYLKFL